jgi:YD repeat-containing protein
MKRLVFGVNPLAVLLCGAVLYGSAPIGFNAMLIAAGDGVAAAVQRMKPRPGPFTDPRRPVWLGTSPGRDPEHLTDLWTPKLRGSLAKAQAKEGSKLRQSRWERLSRTVFELSMLDGIPAADAFEGSGATTTSTSTTTTGGTSGGGPGGFTTGMNDLNSRTGNRLGTYSIVGWSSAGDSRVSFNLYHNSMGGEYLDDVGASWSHSYGIKIDEDPGVSAIVRWADGRRHPYEYDSGDYNPPPGVHDELVENGNGTWTLTTKYQSVLQFDTSGRLTSVTDKHGNTVSVTRSNGLITAITDEDSRSLEFTYNEDDLIETITDPLDRVWELSYNAYDQLTAIEYPEFVEVGHLRAFTYDEDDNMLTETDLEGNVWTFTYDSEDRETSFTDPLDNEWTFAYTSNAATMTDPLDNEVVHNYSLGMVVSTVDAADYSDAYEWDSDKNLVEYTDRRGKVWTATYDGSGNMLTVTDPLTRTWTYTYNGNNFLTSIEDPLENLTEVTYDGGGIKPTSITDPLERTVATLTYDGDGDLLTVEDALERTTEYTYDSYKNVASVTAPDGTEVSATYNLIGWVTSVTDAALDETLVSYDEWGRITVIEHSDESTVSIAYNLEGLIVSATDELDRTGYRTYDDALRLISTENAREDVQEITYNAAGWVTAVENGRGYSREYTYTVRGEVYTLELPDSSLESWAYDAEGNTSSYTNALNQTIGYTYNDAGDLTLINYPTGTDTLFSYDGAGRTVSMTDATGTSEWTFNAAGEVTALDTPQGDLEYVYNLAGQVTEMTANTSDVTSYTYDSYGRFSSLTNPFDEDTSVTYDSAGRVSRKDFDSGVYETFTYDDRSRPTLILVKDSGNSEIDRKEYVWDEASRVTSAKEGGYWSYYEYDAIDQLIEEEKPGLSYLATYTYDDNGNRLTRTVNSVTENYTYDAADKLLDVSINSSVVKEYTYDAAGRTTGIETASGTTLFAYDYAGRITQITYPNSTSDSFAFNALSSRVNEFGANGNRTLARAGLFPSSGLLSDDTESYTPFVSSRDSNVTRFNHSGLRDNVTQSSSDENISSIRCHDTFGNLVTSSGSWAGPHSYASRRGVESHASGFKWQGRRLFDPSVGRYIDPDSLRRGRNWFGPTAIMQQGPVIHSTGDEGLIYLTETLAELEAAHGGLGTALLSLEIASEEFLIAMALRAFITEAFSVFAMLATFVVVYATLHFNEEKGYVDQIIYNWGSGPESVEDLKKRQAKDARGWMSAQGKPSKTLPNRYARVKDLIDAGWPTYPTKRNKLKGHWDILIGDITEETAKKWNDIWKPTTNLPHIGSQPWSSQ